MVSYEVLDLFNFNVDLYESIPQGEAALMSQVHLGVDRLKLYHVFKYHPSLTVEELKTRLKDSPLGLLLETEFRPAVRQARAVDHNSHWILRVAYCKSFPNFFIENELRWFKIRFTNMSFDDRMKFIKQFLPLVEVSDAEKKRLDLPRTVHYVIPFEQVCQLVSKGTCAMSKGNVYVPQHKLVYWLLERLERNLRKELAHAAKAMISSPEEMKYILSCMDVVQPYTYLTNKDFNRAELDEKARHFPLCMRSLLEHLRTTHHLKYFSRQQFGLFLKGLGLSLGEALEMWHDEFTNIMTEDEWLKKRYTYYIEHQYGMRGGKINYEAQNCDTILETGVGAGQTHGCPFKHWDERKLARKLGEEMDASSVRKILELKKEEKYKEACTRCFESIHGASQLEKAVSHPVEYYEKSCNLVDIEDIFM